MPLYDYHCSQCNHTFEVLHARDGEGPSECPNCQAKTPQKMLSAGNFHLKGGGWYVTDFKDPPKKAKGILLNVKDTLPVGMDFHVSHLIIYDIFKLESRDTPDALNWTFFYPWTH